MWGEVVTPPPSLQGERGRVELVTSKMKRGGGGGEGVALASRGGNSGDRECFFSRSPKTRTWEFTKLSSNKLGGATVGREAKTTTASRSFSDSLARA